MPTSPQDRSAPEPSDRSPTAPNAKGEAPSTTPASNEKNGSTGSHHPTKPESLSDILRGSSSRRPSNGSDILHMLADAPPTDPQANTDDSPTVITSNRPMPLPTPLAVSGDAPSVAGRRLGHYELIEAVGAGGMAAVLRARDLELGRIVALKILPPETTRDSEAVTRFKQEARSAALLDHENIARVYYCGEDQGLHFIAFEFVEGETLRQLIDHKGTLTAAESVRYMIQVAAGLNHAAERGVVHRDIKPSNIIITPDGRAKIVDMGLARHHDSLAVNGGVTQSGVTLGTFDYISPEQALDPRRADVRSDIYSLGCAFYHALTGRPPVPEGTAAKKLHAHQHVDPLDPRELNPAIPDELAAVLALMMAKNPDQRYQTPTDLIAHLKGLAERLKLGPDAVPHDSSLQSVPAIQRVLPEPPRVRLGWVVALAAVVIAVAIFAATTGNPSKRAGPPPWGESAGKNTDPQQPVQPGGTANPNIATPADGKVRTAEEFAARLNDPNAAGNIVKVELAPGTVIDLTTLPQPVVFQGKELELVGAVYPPTRIRLHAGECEPLMFGTGRPGPGTFSVGKAEAVSVSGVRFETVHPGFDARHFSPAGFTLLDVERITFTDCSFTVDSVARAFWTGAVRVARSNTASAPRVRAERCLFASGAFGIWVPDRTELTITDSGFGPHESAIRVDDDTLQVATIRPGHARSVSVTLERSSFLLDTDSAVITEPRGLLESAEPGVRVSAGYCVFATVGGSPLGQLVPTVPALMVRSHTQPSAVRFEGQTGRKNAYYGVAALLTRAGADAKFHTFAECLAAKLPIEYRGAVTLGHRPWAAAEPLKVLASDEPWPAFRLKIETEIALFAERDPVVKVIGVQFHNPELGQRPRRAYPDLLVGFPPPPKTTAVPEPRQLVWYPNPDPREEPLPKDTSSDLAFLLRTARSGDTVFIKHNGSVPVERVEVRARGAADAQTYRVTFKPLPGFKPILTATGRDDRDLNQTLFQIHTGAADFEGLQFQLKPARPRDPQRVAAVQLVGGEGCTFTDCVFTLAEEDDARVAVVLIADPEAFMAMDGATRPVPKVKFKNCLVRGKGRGVWVPRSRAVDIDAINTLTALDGPLFFSEPAGKANPSARSSLKLNRVTAFVGGPVVEMRGGKIGEMRASGLVPLDVYADECVFLGVPNAGRSLVELDGIDPTSEKVLEWEVKNANRYANFDAGLAMMVARPGGDGATPKEWDADKWITFAGEPPAAGKPFGKITVEKGPTGLRELAALRPLDATVKDTNFPELTLARPADAGAELEKIPAPWDEVKPE